MTGHVVTTPLNRERKLRSLVSAMNLFTVGHASFGRYENLIPGQRVLELHLTGWNVPGTCERGDIFTGYYFIAQMEVIKLPEDIKPIGAGGTAGLSRLRGSGEISFRGSRGHSVQIGRCGSVGGSLPRCAVETAVSCPFRNFRQDESHSGWLHARLVISLSRPGKTRRGDRLGPFMWSRVDPDD